MPIFILTSLSEEKKMMENEVIDASTFIPRNDLNKW